MADKNEVSIVIKAKDLATATLGTIGNAVRKAGTDFFSFGGLVKGAVGALGAISLGAIIKDLWDIGTAIDGSMRRMAAVLPTGTEGLSDLNDQIARVANTSGRARTEIRAAAEAIAHLGVSSAGEVGVRLEAATKFADATGADLTATIEGLDQVMDLYKLNASEAEQILAVLASASKGRGSPEELFAAFVSAAPALKSLKVDATTATKALVGLLDAGLNTRAVRGEIGKYDAAGLRELAKDAKVSTTALEDLNKAQALVIAGSDRAEQRIRDGFGRSIDRLALSLQRVLAPWLQKVAELMDNIEKNGLHVGIGMTVLGAPKPVAAQRGPGVNAPTPALTAFPNVPHVKTEEEKKAEAEAAKKVREVYVELARLNDETGAGTPKHVLFAQAIAKWDESARAANLTIAQRTVALKALRETQERIRQDVIADILKQGTDAIAEFSTDAVAELDKQISAKVQQLSGGMEQLAPNSPERAKAQTQIEQYIARAAELRVVLQGVTAAERDLATVSAELENPLLDDGKLAADAEHLADVYNQQYRQLQKLKPGTKDYEAVAAQLAKTQEKLGVAIGVVAEHDQQFQSQQDQDKRTAEERRKRILDMAEAWVTYARGAIGALQALNALDDKSAAMLQNVANLGEGIYKIAKSGGKDASGWIEAAGSAASIIGGLFGDSPERKAARQTMERNTEALARLGDVLHSSGLNVTGADLGTARGQLAALMGATGSSTDTMKTGLKELFATLGISSPLLHDVANALGIQIDDTLGSYRRLADAVEIASGSVLKFGTSYAERTLSASAEASIMGITDPIALLKLRARAGIDSSPLIAGLFGGVGDLADPAQRAALLTNIQKLFAGIQAGTITEGLGGLKRDELIALLEQLAGDVRGVQAAAAGGVQATSAGYQALTTVQGDRLLDITQQSLAALRSIDAGVGLLAGRGVVSTAIPMPTLSVAVPQMAGVMLTMRDINVTVPAPAGTMDPTAFGRTIGAGAGRALARELDIAMAERRTAAALRRGSVMVRPT